MCLLQQVLGFGQWLSTSQELPLVLTTTRLASANSCHTGYCKTCYSASLHCVYCKPSVYCWGVHTLSLNLEGTHKHVTSALSSWVFKNYITVFSVGLICFLLLSFSLPIRYIGKADSITISVWNHKKIHKKQGAGFLGCVRLLSNAINRLKDTGCKYLFLFLCVSLNIH